MLLQLNMTQVPLSVRLRSWARMCVYEISSTCNICKKMVSYDSDNFLTMIRIGIGSLQVSIEGLGNLKSADTRGPLLALSWRELLDIF